MTKTLEDVKSDMSDLYDELRKSEVEIKLAAELANIAGKFLKAEQLMLAREHFEANRMQPRRIGTETGGPVVPQLDAAE